MARQSVQPRDGRLPAHLNEDLLEFFRANLSDRELIYWTRGSEAFGRNLAALDDPAIGRLRRVSPVAVPPGEGLLTERTAGVQPVRRERVFMPRS